MTQELPKSAQKVQNYFDEKGFNFPIIELNSSARTAQEAADSLHCNLAQIAKSLIFKNKRNKAPLLIIASGANRVNIKKVEAAIGFKLGRVDGTFVKESVGYAIGGIPPAGHTTQLQTILDNDLKLHDPIWAAAGTPTTMFRLSPDELEQLTQGEWIDLAE